MSEPTIIRALHNIREQLSALQHHERDFANVVRVENDITAIIDETLTTPGMDWTHISGGTPERGRLVECFCDGLFWHKYYKGVESLRINSDQATHWRYVVGPDGEAVTL